MLSITKCKCTKNELQPYVLLFLFIHSLHCFNVCFKCCNYAKHISFICDIIFIFKIMILNNFSCELFLFTPFSQISLVCLGFYISLIFSIY